MRINIFFSMHSEHIEGISDYGDEVLALMTERACNYFTNTAGGTCSFVGTYALYLTSVHSEKSGEVSTQ